MQQPLAPYQYSFIHANTIYQQVISTIYILQTFHLSTQYIILYQHSILFYINTLPINMLYCDLIALKLR